MANSAKSIDCLGISWRHLTLTFFHDHKPISFRFVIMAQLFAAIGKVGLGLAVASGIVNSALYNVNGGYRAVIFDRFTGIKPEVTGEGTHFLVPWVQKPILFDIRSRPRSVSVITGSKGALFDIQKLPFFNCQSFIIFVFSRFLSRFAKCKHHFAYSVPSFARKVAQVVLQSWNWLWRTCSSFHHPGSPQSGRGMYLIQNSCLTLASNIENLIKTSTFHWKGPIRCGWIDHTTRVGLSTCQRRAHGPCVSIRFDARWHFTGSYPFSLYF